MKNSSGQALLEALFVVVFTTIIMFCFLQVCIMAVDDMSANEAAFVGMRSAAVTKGNVSKKSKEARDWIDRYLLVSYGANFAPFSFSDKNTVAPFYQRQGAGEDGENEEGQEGAQAVTIWTSGSKTAKDLSGHTIQKHTLKIYYFTRVIFGKITAPQTSRQGRRYQSSRSRMIPSPDEDYYDKAYPGARKFD